MARRRRGEGRRAILEAVIRIVARDGFDQLTVRAVAAEASVTHGLVTYHFAGREELIREALRTAAERAIHVSALEPASDALDGFAAELADLVAEDPDGQAFQFKSTLERRDAALKVQVRAQRARYLDTVRGTMGRLGLGDDEALARVVLATLDGLVLQQLITGDPEPTRRAVERMHELLAALLDK